jgi:signal transduction histidine kinase
LNVVGQLAAGIAHELNEPLGSILGFAQLTKKSQGLPENISKDIDKIIKSALFARDIIRKLLSFSKEMPPQLKEVNLNKIVLEGLYFLESRCQKNSIELIRNLKNDLPHILADEFQINQVLINLVVNAIQAMPNGGKLTISTDNSVDYVYLIVEDTGIGMSEEIRKKIFLPFFSTKSINEGTGLGLTVCYGIISSHNGTINVESTLGKGSRFEIKIPIYSDSKVKI